jgi:hypothetical protein
MCTACLAAGMSRRLVLGAGVAALTAAPLVATAQAQPARAVDTPDAALTRLVEGNARYVSGKMNERNFSAGRAARAQGQARSLPYSVAPIRGPPQSWPSTSRRASCSSCASPAIS